MMQHLLGLSEPPGPAVRHAAPPGHLSPAAVSGTMPDGFLAGIAPFDTGIPGVVALSAAYRTGRFAHDLYQVSGITCPEALLTAGEKRRAEFLAGRLLARAALASLGLPPAGIGIGAGGAPLWPAGITGSISHSAGRCICLVRNDAAILLGADTERHATGRALTAILRLVLTDADRAMNAALGLPGFPALVFSAKETLYKLLHPVVQRHFGFPCAEAAEPPQDGTLVLRLTRDLHPSLPAGAAFPIRYTTDATHVTTWAVADRPPG